MYSVYEKLLEKQGITSYQVSKETGIAQSTLSDWKNGKSNLKADKLLKLAEYFQVTIDYLVTGK